MIKNNKPDGYELINYIGYSYEIKCIIINSYTIYNVKLVKIKKMISNLLSFFLIIIVNT